MMPLDTLFDSFRSAACRSRLKKLIQGWKANTESAPASKLFVEGGRKRPKGGGIPLPIYGVVIPENKVRFAQETSPFEGLWNCSILLSFLTRRVLPETDKSVIQGPPPVTTPNEAKISRWLEPPVVVPAACIAIFIAYVLYHSFT